MPTPSLIETFCQAGQGQVFAFWEQLSPPERENLLAQAAEIDLAEIEHLKRTLLGAKVEALDFARLQPASYEPLPENGGDARQWQRAHQLGEEALRAGRVAAFTVAGGQGTRLGYEGPKGAFPVTPVNGKTLFQVFAEKIRAAEIRYQTSLHWFIMTSHQNHGETEQFFQENAHFGLAPERVHFFRQGRMPTVDPQGKILLESKSSIAMAPDGHGGSLRALDRSGSLDVMQRAGIDIISFFQVDNPLVQCLDPRFIGWHLMADSEMSSKTVPKAYAEERVGHFCCDEERLLVVEYSDLPLEMQREVDPATGELRFRAGSIAIHLLDREFVRRMARGGQALPFHRANKKIPTIDAEGNSVKPEAANGVKFEMFVFDALPAARNPLVIETRRADEFSPVKNGEGADSPQTCRDDQLRQFARWANANGAGIPVDESGLPTITFEVSPLFGYDDETFAEAWQRRQPQIKEGAYLA